MPPTDQILAGVTAIAREWQWLAVAWHLETVKNGPKDADFNDKLGDWLDSLDL